MIDQRVSAERWTTADRAQQAPPGAMVTPLLRIAAGQPQQTVDSLAIEEPLEIRLIYHEEGQRQQATVAMTMRTPGNDVELALGFLFNEGILSCRQDFRMACHFGPPSEEGMRNVVQVELHEEVPVRLRTLERNFYTNSSCGVCGKRSIDELCPAEGPRLRPGHPVVPKSLIHRLPDLLRDAQAVFESTGGLHAAALFHPDGELRCLREDVGRHNALDKLVGRQLLDGKLPADNCLLVLSGRASFELIQKSTRAGIPIVMAISAPSSLAVRTARQHGITLIGFARGDRFNIYSAPERIAIQSTDAAVHGLCSKPLSENSEKFT